MTGVISSVTKRDSACPSRLALSSFDSEGRTGSLLPHVSACPHCQALLAEVEAARSELLGADPLAMSQVAARRILAEVSRRKATGWQKFWRWLPVGLMPVVAATAMVLVARTPAPTGVDEAPRPALQPSSVRTKGSLALEVVCKRAGNQLTINEGADVFAGDLLRFSFSKDAPGYLVVFSVDDTGKVSSYYPDDVLTGVPVMAGAQQLLPGSVELDGHHGWERIFGLWSAQPMVDSEIRSAVAEGLARAGGDIRQAARLALPAGVDQTSYLLRRP